MWATMPGLKPTPRRVLGEDHPDTLASADNLATDLHNLRAT